ncbi:MAG: aconitate hydratase [Pseudomonadales bacterium]
MTESRTLARKLLDQHVVEGELNPGDDLLIRFNQTLTQDATGTLVMLTLEALDIDRVRPEVAAQYIDHNLIQSDNRNPDDHAFLASACPRFGFWLSLPGNGVSHPLHMQRFGVPGSSLIGSDSHTCAAGSLGMLAVGAGGSDVVLALAGEPVPLRMPQVWGIQLTGRLPEWVSAKDVILELLRRHDVDGARGCVLEYYGSGVRSLSCMDRHVIANMGQELGATTSVFPSDQETRRYLASEGREADWRPLAADDGALYDRDETVALDTLEPLIATPSSPGNVVPVAEVAGEEIHQAYIGSSANPGYRDLAIAAEIVGSEQAAVTVSLDVNPTSRQTLRQLLRDGYLDKLLSAGARLHQTGCNGCIGMGQAPATGRASLRTVPRNFPGRSGTREDRVYLCSPETAAASALAGRITDPRSLGIDYSLIPTPEPLLERSGFVAPPASGTPAELVHGPNIQPLPEITPLSDELDVPVLLNVGDDLSTDEILPAGNRVLPYRSNIAKIAEFTFCDYAPGYVEAAKDLLPCGHAIVAGDNYGQGSSREHAALAPRTLGLRIVIARSFSRIHWQNLVNFGVLPLTFTESAHYEAMKVDTTLALSGIHHALRHQREIEARCDALDVPLKLEHQLSRRQVDILLAGGLVNWLRPRLSAG